MLLPPAGLQLYTVRDLLTRHFEGVLERVAAMGYAGVEVAGFAHITPRQAGKLFRQHGLEVASLYWHLPVGERKNQVLDALSAIGCKRIVNGLSRADIETVESLQRACDQVNQASLTAARRGVTVGLHNHWWEFTEIQPGVTAFDVMVEQLDPKVFFEVDSYWAQTAGVDPVPIVARLSRRAPLLHLKDGPCIRGEPMVALGEGKLDFSAIMEASAGCAEWVLVELDACATDVMEAVQKSYNYLIERGLARGREA